MREDAAEARASTRFKSPISSSLNAEGAAEKQRLFFLRDRCRYCTVNVVEAVTPLKVAVIVVVPVVTPLAKPVVLIVAAVLLLELQVAEVVTS